MSCSHCGWIPSSPGTVPTAYVEKYNQLYLPTLKTPAHSCLMTVSQCLVLSFGVAAGITYFHVTRHWQSNISAISRGWGIRFAADLLDVVEWVVTGANLAFEHLLVSLPEVL